MQCVLCFRNRYSSKMTRYARLVYCSFGFIGLLLLGGASMHETRGRRLPGVRLHYLHSSLCYRRINKAMNALARQAAVTTKNASPVLSVNPPSGDVIWLFPMSQPISGSPSPANR